MVVIVLIFFSCKLLWMFSWWFCCGFDPIVRSILNSPPFGGIFLCFFEALFPYANLSFEKHQRWENLATKLRWWMVCYITSKLTYWMMPNASLVRPQCSSAESKTISTQAVGGEDGGKDCIIIYDMTSENATFYYGKWYFKIQNLLRWTCMKYEDSNIPYHLLIRHAIFHWDGNVTWAVMKTLLVRRFVNRTLNNASCVHPIFVWSRASFKTRMVQIVTKLRRFRLGVQEFASWIQ